MLGQGTSEKGFGGNGGLRLLHMMREAGYAYGVA
jgi:hypothetical protein